MCLCVFDSHKIKAGGKGHMNNQATVILEMLLRHLSWEKRVEVTGHLESH